MAFGFGFNKQKVLSAAEKYVQQGKLQNAIAEYEKVLKADAKDLTVTNTVGDLYSRLGEVDKATECFKTVGDAYATQGFTVKAIAMYKKISKLKPSLESVLKLAELYTQQGLFNDARAQYLQVAEEFLKAGELENAVRIFQKILEMDPENTAMRVRLAEVYVRLGKKTEAWQIFSAAAEGMRSKGSLSGAEEVLQRMLTLDPGNSYALLMQGKNLLEAGDAESAITTLQKVSDLDSNPDGLRDLLKAYLQSGRLSDAGTLANKLLTVHNDLSAISTFADALMQAGQYENALQVYDQHADRLLAENPDKVIEHLHSIIGHVRDNSASLDKLLDLFHKSGDTTHVSEVTELLAHASVQSGDLVRARDLYQKLATLEPQNPLHMKSYQQVVSQMGGTTGTKLISTEEAAVIVDELEATAPPVHQHYSDVISMAVRSALTDAELFISYNMPAKALGPLMAALPQAPHDQRLNQRLAALHTRAGRFAEAAMCCRTLENIYSEAEFPEEATRYGELAARYEERSSVATELPAEESVALELPADEETGAVEAEEFAVAETSVESHAAAWPTMEAKPAEAEEFSVVDESAHAAPQEPADSEIDLSSEWEDATTVEGELPAVELAEVEISDSVGDHELPAAGPSPEHAPDPSDETVEEIRFYIAHGMLEQAWAAFAKLQTVTRDPARVAELRAEVEAAAQAVAAEQEAVAAAAEANDVQEIVVDDLPTAAEFAVEQTQVEEEIPVTAPAVAQEPVVSAQAAEPEPEIAEAIAEVPAEETAETEIAETDTPVMAESVVAAEPEPVHEAAPPAPVMAAPAPDALHEFVAELETSLGDSFLPGTIAKPVEAHQAPEAQAAETHAKFIEPPVPVTPEVVPEVVASAHAEAPGPSDHASGHAEGLIGEFVADLESSLGDDFLKAAPVAEPLPAAPAAPVEAVSTTPVASPVSDRSMAASAAASTGTQTQSAPPPTPISPAPIHSTPVSPSPTLSVAATAPAVEATQPVAPVLPPAPAVAKSSPFGEEASVDLAEMFGELKQDLESGVSATEEDPETHYNLGIAFREMGLLDEAIGELQKACQSVDRGHPFPQIMQAYTWLAQCFLEKGVPEAAVRWYDRALNVAGIDGETRTALHYELASAYESAGDKPSALKHFMDVYGSNIDYRDVAERIKALKS